MYRVSWHFKKFLYTSAMPKEHKRAYDYMRGQLHWGDGHERYSKCYERIAMKFMHGGIKGGTRNK